MKVHILFRKFHNSPPSPEELPHTYFYAPGTYRILIPPEKPRHIMSNLGSREPFL
jgi:hypothetical protein